MAASSNRGITSPIIGLSRSRFSGLRVWDACGMCKGVWLWCSVQDGSTSLSRLAWSSLRQGTFGGSPRLLPTGSRFPAKRHRKTIHERLTSAKQQSPDHSIRSCLRAIAASRGRPQSLSWISRGQRACLSGSCDAGARAYSGKTNASLDAAGRIPSAGKKPNRTGNHGARSLSPPYVPLQAPGSRIS